ncbi:transposase [Aetokthonos hydrillicola Thurmond2011]|uniref:Transposase n=1 Tax=Aetokthonos hydrillicola Thurmond2011 TaxID=2712845 RepID=A0AAP5IAP8_9CYAN|nr:transposase [Aetokthonos hydrillicola]MDR9898045.1 transposase [Aetokthonos hydrillicola Thurmond2011]
MQHYRKNKLWSDSYCVVSCGGAPLQIVKQYIQNQNQKSLENARALRGGGRVLTRVGFLHLGVGKTRRTRKESRQGCFFYSYSVHILEFAVSSLSSFSPRST